MARMAQITDFDVEVEITVKYRGTTVGARRSETSGNPTYAVAVAQNLITDASHELSNMLTTLYGDIQTGRVPQ